MGLTRELNHHYQNIDNIDIPGCIQNMDWGPWTIPMDPVPGPPLIFEKEIAPVNINIYRRSGYEKHGLVFIAPP